MLEQIPQTSGLSNITTVHAKGMIAAVKTTKLHHNCRPNRSDWFISSGVGACTV